jgi:hypothetical protein
VRERTNLKAERGNVRGKEGRAKSGLDQERGWKVWEKKSTCFMETSHDVEWRGDKREKNRCKTEQ